MSDPSEFEGVAVFQPIEIRGLWMESPVDGLLIAIGEESAVCEGDGGGKGGYGRGYGRGYGGGKGGSGF